MDKNRANVGQKRCKDSTFRHSMIGGMQKPPESPNGGHVQRLRGDASVYTYYIYVCSATGIGSVNAVGTHCVRPDNDTRRVNPVETRRIASSPYFPPYLIHKTTSVASGIPSPAQPYYLMYSMKGANKGIRLDVVCAPLAAEVVSSGIRSKIRYDATTAGIPVETRFIASSQSQSQSQSCGNNRTISPYPFKINHSKYI